MKTLVTTILLLIGIMSWGQEAKLDYWWALNHTINDTGAYVLYTYDSTDYLEEVYYTPQGLSSFDEITYSNDTLIKIWHGGVATSYYYYLDDTVMIISYYQGVDTSYLRINEDNEVIEDGSYTWIWENGNCVNRIFEEDTTLWFEYYSEYLNPWYEENKYLRGGDKTGTFSGSINLWSNLSSANGTVDELIVMESIGSYPAIIDHYTDGNLWRTYYFEYKYITDTPEISEESAVVISIEYFDMLGRKIPKPSKGFYIERKTTDKGIISTKHYQL